LRDGEKAAAELVEVNYVTDKDLFERLKNLLNVGEYSIDEFGGYRGTGTAGFILEELLGFDPTNKDGPDSGRWEVKFHSGSSPLTLFHKTPEPEGVMRGLLKACGWTGRSGRLSFRHTIWGQSDRGLAVRSENQRVIVDLGKPGIQAPFWTHDTIVNAFAYKLRRLIVVHGKVRKAKGLVVFESAQLLQDPRTTAFVQAICDGIVAIDFDFRATDTEALRDHGTKFRIKIGDLQKLYETAERF
jgi:MvaI/BcnI restriction endonuclease family